MDTETQFLDPKVAALVKNYRLLARLVVKSFFAGHHKGAQHAISLEYSKHRDYYPGDPLRLVDWKLFGRSDRLFVKQYQEETNLQSWILLDTSASMLYTGSQSEMSKLKYASSLAAVFAYLFLLQRDQVGLMTFDNRLRKVVAPHSNSRQLFHILRELQVIRGGGVSDFDQASRLAASRIRRRGMVVFLSDCLLPPERIREVLKRFLIKGSEVILFHVLSHEEVHFPLKRFGLFEDMETGKRLLIDPRAVADEYREKMREYLAAVKRSAEANRVEYRLLETRTRFDEAIIPFLEARRRML